MWLLFLSVWALYGYKKVNEEHFSRDLLIEDDIIQEELEWAKVLLEWYRLNLADDLWHTLNDHIGMIKISENQKISFEGFIKFVDLLFQNEDCKYYYKNVIINGNQRYKYGNGRPNSSAANLLILNYFEGNERISTLLNSFQKSRGVAHFKNSDYTLVTDGIVINTDRK